jgi:iron complex transport system ATP-binding protein
MQHQGPSRAIPELPPLTATIPFPDVPDPLLPSFATPHEIAAVELSRVSVRGGKHTLLDNVSLSVGKGEHWAILGANGAGKTTLLDVVRGVAAPSSGDVAVVGERHGAHGYADPRLRIGVVESSPPVFAARLTAGDVVLLRSAGPPALRGSRVDPDEVQRARTTLSMVGCADLVDRRYAQCSHGERQRINLARALFRAPAVVLLDEPAAGLDLPGRAALLAAMAGLAAARPSLATITVTHHVEELPATTTHAALLRAGAIVAAGAVADVITGAALSECFGVPVDVCTDEHGWRASVTRPSWGSA